MEIIKFLTFFLTDSKRSTVADILSYRGGGAQSVQEADGDA